MFLKNISLAVTHKNAENFPNAYL